MLTNGTASVGGDFSHEQLKKMLPRHMGRPCHEILSRSKKIFVAQKNNRRTGSQPGFRKRPGGIWLGPTQGGRGHSAQRKEEFKNGTLAPPEFTVDGAKSSPPQKNNQISAMNG